MHQNVNSVLISLLCLVQFTKAGSVLGNTLDSIEITIEKSFAQKVFYILDNTTHPLHVLLVREQTVQLEAASASM